MAARIRVISKQKEDVKKAENDGFTVIDTTSRCRARPVIRGQHMLSPFYLSDENGRRMENLWQYAKLYDCHRFQYTGKSISITAGFPGWYSSVIPDVPEVMPDPDWDAWHEAGIGQNLACRYPMGKGARPLFSVWTNPEDQKRYALGYVAARKLIYAPLYAQIVRHTDAFKSLLSMLDSGKNIALADFDGFDPSAYGLTIKQVIDFPRRPMGHAFVLAVLLDKALNLRTL